MSWTGIADPVGVTRAAASLIAELDTFGYTLEHGSDLHAFNAIKLAARGERAGPYHDPDVAPLPEDRVFWMALMNDAGKAIALQAFRLDVVDKSLADWAQNYTIGLYMRRQELLVPTHNNPPKGSISERIKGKLAYQGELWIDKSIRNRRVYDAFGRLGMIFALIKWQPDALWALVAQSMATHGHVTRMGYPYLERGFFRWQMQSEGIDPVEWIAITERAALEALVDEMLTTEQPQKAAR